MNTNDICTKHEYTICRDNPSRKDFLPTQTDQNIINYEIISNFKKKGLHVINLNIQHLIPKLDEIKYHLSQTKNHINIFGFCETFLNENTPDSKLMIQNYVFERKDRSNKSGGGVLTYIADTLPYKRRIDLENSFIEAIWIEVCYTRSKPFLIGFVYRPPNSQKNWCEQFSEMMDSIDKENLEYHIVGDFNFEYILHSKKFQTTYWNDFVQAYDITQLVESPTRVTQSSSTIIDHLYSNMKSRITEVFVSSWAISDHSPVCFTRSARGQKISDNTHKTITYRSFNKFELTDFQMDLACSSMDDIEKMNDPNASLTTLYSIVNGILNYHAPLKQKRVKTLSQPTWFTQEIKDAIKIRDRINKKTNFSAYKVFRNKVTYLIKRAKKEFYNNAVKQSTDTKLLWKNMREITGSNNNGILIPKTLRIGNEEITGENNIVNTFNDHFINICETIKENKFNKNSFSDLEEHLEGFLQGKCFSIQPITPYQVKLIIEKLDSSKATGIDVLGPQILKYCKDYIVIPITSIINNSIRLGIFPDSLKESFVMPIYKNKDKEDPNNYRPISILPTISKIFERHIASQLMEYFCEAKLLHNFQSGFRKHHSCHTALLRLVHDWIEAIDNGKLIGTVFLDLRKAFDLVDHQILLHKLKLHHFDSIALKLFESYLSKRTQIVKVGNVKSDKKIVKCGVPQGSILGPLLFLIYINDISFNVKHSIIDLYADDSTLYTCSKAKDDIQVKLQEDLHAVMQWCDVNNMAIHPGKTTCMLIGSPHRTRLENDLLLKIGDTHINNVSSQKLLGVIVDKNLKWESQVNAVCKKVNAKLFLLKRIISYLDDGMKTLFYNSYILPIFDYCCVVWGIGKQSHIMKIAALQKRAAKIILCKSKITPSIDLFKTLNWLTFESRCHYHAGVLIYKSLKNNVPDYISNLIKFSHNERYMLRSSSKQNIAQTTRNTDIKKQSFEYVSVQVWNSIPIEIRTSNTLNTFKHKYKQHLLSLQFV